MNKNDIRLIEKIISNINELDIMTNGRNDNYFYDSYEMPVLCNLVDAIDECLKKISKKLKEKYNNINWQVIEERKYNDNVFGSSLKLGEIWKLASGVLKSELLDSLIRILKLELPVYYTNYSNKMHEKAMKESGGKKYIYKRTKEGAVSKIEVN